MFFARSASLAVLAAGAYFLLADDARARMFNSGADLARGMVAAAKINGGVVAIAPSAKFCIYPGMGTGVPFGIGLMQDFYENAPIVFVESNLSEGAWYAALLNGEGAIELYEISNSILRWDIEGDAAYKDLPTDNLILCPASIAVDLTTKPPRVSEFRGSSRE